MKEKVIKEGKERVTKTNGRSAIKPLVLDIVKEEEFEDTLKNKISDVLAELDID